MTYIPSTGATIGLADTLRKVRRSRTRNLLDLDDALLDDAAAIDANDLRSLDAIHIASAQQLQAALDALVTYDDRMLTAARALGLPVSRPT